jgi:hypothetical protein
MPRIHYEVPYAIHIPKLRINILKKKRVFHFNLLISFFFQNFIDDCWANYDRDKWVRLLYYTYHPDFSSLSHDPISLRVNLQHITFIRVTYVEMSQHFLQG